jgi:translation initiation factor 1 (eIF-1/SUI1)
VSIQASLDISVSAQSINLFDAIKDSANNSGLEYSESSECLMFDAVDTPSTIISKNIKFVTTVSAIASFLIQIQPTIQEVIKANASKGITITCGDKKIEVQGENDIEKAVAALKKLSCDPDNLNSDKPN